MRQKTDDIFGKIKAALSLENPGEILGREKEAKDIRDFVTEAIKDEIGCSLYISGQPGTGKSATINNIISQIDFKKLKTQKGMFFIQKLFHTRLKYLYIERIGVKDTLLLC